MILILFRRIGIELFYLPGYLQTFIWSLKSFVGSFGASLNDSDSHDTHFLYFKIIDGFDLEDLSDGATKSLWILSAATSDFDRGNQLLRSATSYLSFNSLFVTGQLGMVHIDLIENLDALLDDKW